MTASLRMDFPYIGEKNPNCFRTKSILFEETAYVSVTVLSDSALLWKYFLHKTHLWRKKLFPHKNRNCLSSRSKEVLFLLSFVKLMKMFCQNAKSFDQRFYPIKAFDKYTLCISTYYKCNDEWIHLAITDFWWELKEEKAPWQGPWDGYGPTDLIMSVITVKLFSLFLWHFTELMLFNSTPVWIEVGTGLSQGTLKMKLNSF